MFAKKGVVLCYEDGDDIEKFIDESWNREFPEYISQTDNIAQMKNVCLDKI